MKKKVAIFIDWDNFRRELETVTKTTNTNTSDFDFNKIPALMCLIKSFLQDDEELYRIFIYTAPPFNHKHILNELKRRKTSEKELNLFNELYEKNKNKLDSIYNRAKNFIEDIALEEYVALRKGILKIGKICNGEVVINQKQVDMLIGLDIAQLSYENRVDRIVVLSLDTDMKPAIKVARINGIHTIIGCLEEYKAGIPKELKEHSDTIRKISFKKFLNNYKLNK